MAKADWLQLAGQVAVVTGSAQGIGAEIARELAGAGALVAVLDRNLAGAQETASVIAAAGGRAAAVACDVAEPSSVREAAEQVQRELGRCSILVNNAAMIYAESLINIEMDRWNQLMAVNVGGYLQCAQAFGRQMMEGGRGGSMIHIASVSGHFPQAYSGPYSVSKAGVKMLSRLLAVELGEHGVRSNVVSPAMVLTPLSEGFYSDPELRRKRESIAPIGRIGMPKDIAEAVLYLASPRASYVSGQDILVDGALSANWLTMIPRPGLEKKDAQAQ